MERTSASWGSGIFRLATIVALAGAAAPGCGRAQAGSGAFPGGEERRASAFEVSEAAASRDDTLFTVITGLDVDSRGRIYAGDWQAGRVVVLDPSGALVRTVGRQGLGPGEFRSVRGVQVLPGDSLLVYDPSAARISVFAPDTEQPAYVVNLAATLGGAPPFLVRRLPGGAFAVLFRPQFAAGDTAARRDSVVVLNADGSRRGPALRAAPSKGFLHVTGGRGFAVTPDPFGREFLFTTGPAGEIHLAWSDSLAVESVDASGAPIGRFRAPHQPPPVTGADAEAETAAMGPQGAQMFAEALRDSLPQRWPAARAMLADEEGRIWLALNTPGAEPWEWAAFQADGRYLGSAFVPRDVEVWAIRGGMLYGVRPDENDVPHVVVYRAEMPRR
jgi:hypothetical protein